jgi:LysM repeat protein
MGMNSGPDLSSNTMAKTAAILFFLVLVAADILVGFAALKVTFNQIKVEEQEKIEDSRHEMYVPMVYQMVLTNTQVVGSGAAPAEAPTETPVVEPTAIMASRTHTVKSGDTLGQIAQQYGISLDALVKANQIANPDVISVGQELIIPPQ